jgi:hypothetical protein
LLCSSQPLPFGFNIQHFDKKVIDQDGDQIEAADQYYEVKGTKYRCTGAHVRFGINQSGGSE